MSLTTETAPEKVKPTKKSGSITAGGLAIKLGVVGMIDALLVWMLIQAFVDEWWLAVGFFILALVAVNFVYFTRGLPMKYLLPGLLFLLVFQVFTIILTGYTSFTNYGTGHLDDQAAAINALEVRGERPVEGSADYPVVPVARTAWCPCWSPSRRARRRRASRSSGPPSCSTPVPPADVQKTGEKVNRSHRLHEPSTWERSAPTRTSTRNGRSCASRSTWTRYAPDPPGSRWPKRCGPATCTTRPPTP